MSAEQHTPGPWWVTDSGVRDVGGYICHTNKATRYEGQDERYERETAERAANASLLAAAPDLLSALHEGRRAIGDHFAPNDCYATGPLTGDHIRDLVQCPACSFIAMYDAAIAKATGSAS